MELPKSPGGSFRARHTGGGSGAFVGAFSSAGAASGGSAYLHSSGNGDMSSGLSLSQQPSTERSPEGGTGERNHKWTGALPTYLLQ